MAASGAMADFARMPTQQQGHGVRGHRRSARRALLPVRLQGPRRTISSEGREREPELAARTRSSTKDIPEFDEAQGEDGELEADHRARTRRRCRPRPRSRRSSRRSSARSRESGVEIVQVEEAQGGAGRALREGARRVSRSTARSCRSSGSSRRWCPRRSVTADAPAHGGQVEERERIVSIENLALTNPVVRNREIQTDREVRRGRRTARKTRRAVPRREGRAGACCQGRGTGGSRAIAGRRHRPRARRELRSRRRDQQGFATRTARLMRPKMPTETARGRHLMAKTCTAVSSGRRAATSACGAKPAVAPAAARHARAARCGSQHPTKADAAGRASDERAEASCGLYCWPEDRDASRTASRAPSATASATSSRIATSSPIRATAIRSSRS